MKRIISTLLILTTTLTVKSQAVLDTTTFLLNQYLVTNGACNPYPQLIPTFSQLIDTNGLKNVMNYGAVGNGTTNDDAAIVAAFNAADAAGTGVYFPPNKTFLVHQLNNISLSKNIIVWAYGATIKMKALSQYSAFSFNYPDGERSHNLIWLGGTLDGNKDNQSWPGSPTGDSTWEEDHGQFARVLDAGFALFKDVDVTGVVVDGITFTRCRIAMIESCTAENGAPLRYSEVQDQGTYFKVRQPGGTADATAFYVNNTTCSFGSIGVHYSTNYIEDSSVTVLNNVEIFNGAQDAIHFEHCKKNIMFNCHIWKDTTTKWYNGSRVRKYSADIHVSNNTVVAWFKKCLFQNARIDPRNSSDMVLGIVDSCRFINDISNTDIDDPGHFTHVINSYFKGTSALGMVSAYYIKKSTFENFGSQAAIINGKVIDSCTFINGSVKPISGTPQIFHCTFTNCTSPNTNQTPAGSYIQNFQKEVALFDNSGNSLGFATTDGIDITCPNNDIFFSQKEMTPSGGQPYDELYWLNSNNASLSISNVVFPTTGQYRIDMSGKVDKGTPQVQILIDGVAVATLTMNTTNIQIFSTLISSISAGTHTVTAKLINFNSAANYGKVGLFYFTQTSTPTPPTFPAIQPADITVGQWLTANSYGSKHLRGFNLGSNGTNQSGENASSMTAMAATGANIARCFVQIERPSGDTYQFKAGELLKLDSTVARGQRLGFYVVPVLYHDPALNTDYWGNAARKASIAHLWATIATKYKSNPYVGGYDLINEPRSNFNYAEVIRFEQQMIDTIRSYDNNHVVMVECISNDMFAMMLPLYKYTNVVYSPHGYSTLVITHQGVSASDNIRNVYPAVVSTSNLTAPWGITQLSTQHDDVRTMTHRFNVPVFIGEFSCVNWSPLSPNSAWKWTSTQWIYDNITLLEAEGWSWAYNDWVRGGEYIGWDPEIPSSWYLDKTYVNAKPTVLPTTSDRSDTAATIVMLKQWFGLNTTTPVVTTSTAQSPDDFAFGFTGSGTHIGMLVNGGMTLTEKVNLANTYGVKYIRDGTTMTNFSGNIPNNYKTWYDAGFKLLYNIQYQATNPPVRFPRNETNYKDTLNLILNTLAGRPPVLLVCENEEMNANNFTEDVNPAYFNELTWFVQTVHARGYKATNGGLTDNAAMDVLVYRALVADNNQAAADEYGSHAMTNSQILSAQQPGRNPDLDARAAAMLNILQTYANIGVDYINLHMSYERNIDPNAPISDTNTLSKNVIKWRQWYVLRTVGKKVISNEIGQSNLSPTLVTLMLQQYAASGYDYVIWFNGDGDGGVGARALNDQDSPYPLRTNGDAFKEFMLGSAP